MQLLQELGLVDMLHPDRLSSKSLSAWFSQEKSASQSQQKLDLKGLERIPQFLAQMLEETTNHVPSLVQS